MSTATVGMHRWDPGALLKRQRQPGVLGTEQDRIVSCLVFLLGIASAKKVVQEKSTE